MVVRLVLSEVGRRPNLPSIVPARTPRDAMTAPERLALHVCAP
jgi:hypothetical protein